MAVAVGVVFILGALFPPDEPQQDSLAEFAWTIAVGARTFETPNPYQSYLDPPRLMDDTFPARPLAPMAFPEHKWFEMEDTGNMMGMKLGRGVVSGLQVEFVGPSEEPKVSRRMTNYRFDPFHPRYLLATAGIRIAF